MRPHARRRATVVTASSSGEMSSEQRGWFQQRAYDFEVEVGALKTLYRDVTAAVRAELLRFVRSMLTRFVVHAATPSSFPRSPWRARGSPHQPSRHRICAPHRSERRSAGKGSHLQPLAWADWRRAG